MPACRRSRMPRVRLHNECVRVNYHEPRASVDASDTIPHVRVAPSISAQHTNPHVRLAPSISAQHTNPHVRLARSMSAEQANPSVYAEQADNKAGFDDRGPEPTEADIQRAARVSAESTDYLVPEPGSVTVRRELTFDDSSDDGRSTGGVSTGDQSFHDSSDGSDDGESTGGVSTVEQPFHDSAANGVSTGDQSFDDSSDGSDDGESTGGVSTAEQPFHDSPANGVSTGGVSPGGSTGDKDESTSEDDSKSTSSSSSAEDEKDRDWVFDYAKHCKINDNNVIVTEKRPVCSLSHVTEHPFTIGNETFWTMYHWISASAAYVLAFNSGEAEQWRITRHNKAHRRSIMMNRCPLQAKKHLDAMRFSSSSMTDFLEIVEDVVEYGLFFRFATHPQLKSFLLSTGDKNITYLSDTDSNNIPNLNEVSSRALTKVRHHFSKGSEKDELKRIKRKVDPSLRWLPDHLTQG